VAAIDRAGSDRAGDARRARPRRGAALGALLAAVLVWGAAAADGLAGLIADLRLAPGDGQEAPAFTVPTLAGGRASLADYRGQVLLLYFWASW